MIHKNKIKFGCDISNRPLNHTDKKTQTKLIIGCLFCVVFTVCQITGGILSNSLAILTDSAHIFSDFLSFVVSLVAIYLANRTPSDKMHFGWKRAEVIGALFSVLLIWLVTGILVYSAIHRIMKGEFEINSNIMLIMSAIGVMVNIILACILHPHSHSHSHAHEFNDTNSSINDNSSIASTNDASHPLLSQVSESITSSPIVTPGSKMKNKLKSSNLNLRAAFIHVLGDIIQSFGVLTASMLIYFKPEWKIADPICTFIFSVLVLFTTISIFRDVLAILFEKCPSFIHIHSLISNLTTIPGILDVHHIRVWRISSLHSACICHISIETTSNSQEILHKAKRILQNNWHITEVTIQIEKMGYEFIE